MKKKQKGLLVIAGVISIVLGAIFMFPAYASANYFFWGFCTVLIIGGIIILALGLGD